MLKDKYKTTSFQLYTGLNLEQVFVMGLNLGLTLKSKTFKLDQKKLVHGSNVIMTFQLVYRSD